MLKHLALMFGIQTATYVVLVLNLRALNRGKYVWTGVTEMVYALANFWIIGRVASASSWQEAVAYASGATVGSLIAIWITKHWE